MGEPDSVIRDFAELHERYIKAHSKIIVLQATAIEGIRKIGVGCLTRETRDEFIALEKEINETLEGMRRICESLH